MPSTPALRIPATEIRFISVAIAILFLLTPAGAVESQDSTDVLQRKDSELRWHDDYSAAHALAKNERRMLLVNFVPAQEKDLRAQREFEESIEANESLQDKLGEFVCVRVPDDVEIADGEARIRLREHPAFQPLVGPGLAMIDLRDPEKTYYGRVVTVLPYASGKYYRWKITHISAAIDLPAGSLSQRTMVWAVRVHEEGPESTTGVQHAVLSQAAAEQSAYQAEIGVQGHHHWETRVHRLHAAVEVSGASEVVAESWPDENLLDACIDCVASWRQSPGHWQAVRKRHRLFGYDIRRGRNGIWYGTGIFAN